MILYFCPHHQFTLNSNQTKTHISFAMEVSEENCPSTTTTTSDDLEESNLMEGTEQAVASSDDSDSDENDSDMETEQSASSVQMEVSPNDYNGHLELIKKLKEVGDLKRLREARENMNRVFPLSPELWLSWIEDECTESKKSTPEGRSSIVELFDRAVGDYLSVELWLEYVHFTIGYMSEPDGSVEKVRSLFERAIVAAGLHVSKGILLWESYREFEMIVLTTMMTQSVGENADLADQLKRVANLFKRQLSVPLLNMEKTYPEFIEWIETYKDKWVEASGKPDTLPVEKNNVDLVYKKALQRLHQIEPFENILATSKDAEKVVHYKEYLKFEQSFADPVRLISLFERAFTDCPLDGPLWLGYVEFLDGMCVGENTLKVCKRSVRNCPWYSLLWQQYIRTMEKSLKSHDEIESVFQDGLQSGMQTAEDYRNLWIEYCSYLRRQIKWGTAEENTMLSDFRDNIIAGCEHLDQYFGQDGDSGCELLRLLAAVDAVHSRQMDEARKTWNEIMNRGHKNSAASWLQNIHLEMAYGDNKHLRRLFPRALQSTHDWPESIVQEWLQFERVEGSVESYENALFKCRSRMKEVNAQREKTAAVSKAENTNFGTSSWKKTQSKEENVKFKNVERLPKQTDLKEPPIKQLKRPAPTQSDQKNSVPPPPGYVPEASKKPKLDSVAEHGAVVQHDPSKDDRTAFVSNLDFSVDEDQIREIFSSVGTITDLRLVKDFRGRSKGFCYVVFQSHKDVNEALKKDRDLIDGRPMFVSKCDPDRGTRQHGFRWSTNREKNKLFVKGLPKSTTKEDLEKLFGEFGTIKDIRLVIYRNGHFKGLAYVDFEKEAAAAHAIIKVDGTTIGDKVVSVAISQPPDRRTSLIPDQQEQSTSFARSLGGGVKDVGARGRGRTQVSFVPRALQVKSDDMKKDDVVLEPSSSVISNSNGTPKSKSNADFRQMLLGKKL